MTTERTQPLSRSDRIAVWIADRVLARPWITILTSLALVSIVGSGVRHLEFSNNYRVFFSADNPELIAFENFQRTYTKNDNILFILQPEAGTSFEPDTAAALEWLTEEAWKIPFAIRVDSVTNFQHSWADADDLTVEALVRDARSMDPLELRDRAEVALAEPLLRGNLLSPDARTTGVNVTLQYPEKDLTEVPEAVAHARALAEELRTRQPGLRVGLSGVSMLNNAFAESGQMDALTLMPVMFGMLVLLMTVVLRSAVGTLGTLIIISLSVLTAFGATGLVGVKLDPISLTAAVIIMTLGLADSIHLLTTVFGEMRRGRAKGDAIRESLRVNLLAVVITSLTTIIGFLSLNFSDAPPFRHLGDITAVGILAALFFSVVFLPAFLALVPVRVRQTSTSNPALGRFADWVTSRYKPILASMGAAAVALMALAPSIDLNDEFVKYFDHRIAFRSDAEWGIENLNGIYLLEFSLEAAEPGGISDPEYLAHLERFTRWLRDQPEVMHVYSYSDVIQRLNMNMHGDDPSWYRVPEDRAMAAQYLLLYGLSLPYGLDLGDRISIDKSATRLTATVGEISTAQTRVVLDRATDWLKANAPEPMHADPTGAAVMFSRISERNIASMLRGNAVAVVLIAVVMMFALRSFSLGALSLIPNTVPILMTFGVWAVLVKQVGMAAATVSATSLGIIVDDTVHFLTKYLRARREEAADRPAAIRYAFETVGSAIISTSIILVFGFGVLAFSSFRLNAQMGLLTMIAILLALACDLLLLPALLMVGHTEKGPQPLQSPGRLSPIPTTFLLTAVFLGTGLVPALHAETGGSDLALESMSPEQRGWAIAARSDRSDRGFTDSVVEMQMVLKNKAGKETTRLLELKTMELPDEDIGDRNLIVFESPADIDGTALLSHAKILDPDDQWLYLPALKRVKRISSVNKSGPFVGSEFAFEDLTALELEKFSYRYLREENCDDQTCDVLELTPRYEHSGYTRQIAWVDQQAFQFRKLEFYDRRGDLLKTLLLADYRLYGERYWRPHTLHMVNHQTGKETRLVYSEYAFATGLGESDFVRGALRRQR